MKKFLFLYYFYVMKIQNIKNTMTSQLSRDSFVGSWFIKENNKKKIIHLKPHGVIYESGKEKSNYIGYWNTEENSFYFNLRDNNIEKKYYGKIFNNTLNISGQVCEGITNPFYINNFTMLPLFKQFHNISIVNKTDSYTYLNQHNVTGKWMLENVNTNKLYLLELHLNNTWNSINFNYNNNRLNGKWNLFNETNEININSAIKFNGRNIWLNINNDKNQSYYTYDIIFVGKILKLATKYLYNETKKIISSKINGTVVHGFDMEPDVSERFYMKRWFDN